MKTIMRNLIGLAFIAAAVVRAALTQNTTPELRLRDIKAQQPQETIYESMACQNARKDPRGSIYQDYVVDPRTLVKDLNALMENSDEVVLAGRLGEAAVISPNGKSPATYTEVRVIRSWKGSHHAGDNLIFGSPFGHVSCEPTGRFDGSTFLVTAWGWGVPVPEPVDFVWVLFLRQSKGDETQWVQGLRLATGEGLQGVFTIGVPPSTHDEPDPECSGNQWSWQRCDAYLQASQFPVMVSAPDPLAKRYDGMPVPDFLHEVQSVAGRAGIAEEPSLR